MKRRIPWVYGGCLGAEGQTMTIVPGDMTALERLFAAEMAPDAFIQACSSLVLTGLHPERLN